MEVPQPPQDEELKNIIQKLAVFVARNGPEFEAMTKQKQQGNPHFGFLFGGEYYNYYMYRVTTEQAVLKHKAAIQQRQLGVGGGPGGMQQQQGPPGGPGPGQFGSMGGFNNSPTGPQQQNFGGPPPPLQQQQQRFPSQMFDQQQGGGPPRGPPHVSRFDRGPGGQPMPMHRFERPPMNAPPPFQHGQQNFDNFGNGGAMAAFDGRGPPPLHSQGGGGGPGPGIPGFDFNSHQQGPPPPHLQRGFDQGGRGGPVGGGSGGFDGGRGPPTGRFDDRGPPPMMGGDFDMRVGGGGGPPTRPPGGFDNRGPPGFSPNFVQQQQVPPQSLPISSPGPVQPSQPLKSLANIAAEIETLTTQKAALEEQIKQSEQNLTAQNQVLMAQQQQQIEESIRLVQDVEIKQLAEELNIDLNELENVLQPIVESCTKDSISGGKAWIFTHTSTPRHYQLLSLYLLRKTTDPDASFCKRLHIIYLVNDVLHHCMRKGAEDLQIVLEAMVIPMFCHAKVKEAGNEENLTKLNKLLTLWENKNQYVSSIAVDKLRDASNTWLEYHSELLKRHAVVVTQIAQNIQKTYEGYQSQHQMFCQHVSQNIKTMEQQLQQLLAQQQLQQAQQQQFQQQSQMKFSVPVSGVGGPPPGIPNIPPPGLSIPVGTQPPPARLGIPGMPTSTGYPGQRDSVGSPGPAGSFVQQAGPAGLNQVSAGGENVSIPLDISRPPPGFPPPPVSEKELTPALPYYELPAGLMVPLVKPEDDTYKPIDPKAIRLPPPCPPSERLLQAVEAFYGPPSHERPRDSEGWERLGLYEYFKSKNLARKQKEDDIREGRREKSKSPSPIRRDSSPSGRSPPRRRYQSKSPTPLRRRRSRSRSPSSSSRRKSRRRSRSRSRSPKRSPTPPSFGMAGLGMDRKLDESNKGHQLLKKMGWGGSGLGANEQGISNPISGGEIREKKDLYKGVGISMNDPFESYRKSKGQAFVERMRARADDRP